MEQFGFSSHSQTWLISGFDKLSPIGDSPLSGNFPYRGLSPIGDLANGNKSFPEHPLPFPEPVEG
jgi:hypothetical protein